LSDAKAPVLFPDTIESGGSGDNKWFTTRITPREFHERTGLTIYPETYCKYCRRDVPLFVYETCWNPGPDHFLLYQGVCAMCEAGLTPDTRNKSEWDIAGPEEDWDIMLARVVDEGHEGIEDEA